jgi:eukaryotic-like serine/threonine-protein kinase
VHVCEGVQHAHQKAIIHRDLKPSNILITEVDGHPAPKIIDFGVAKATSQLLTGQTMLTRVGSVIGTPEYMSPEQADTAGEDIDTRSDVYSLGVVLYELLVGALPLKFNELSFAELLRKLREEDAPRPSTKARSGEQSATAAKNRRIDPPTLIRRLQGDLDAITLKALEKERSRRYATPTELAADIGRYLRNEPVLARSGNAAYRARKYLRRHRLAIAAAATVLVLLGSFAVVEAVQLRRIKRESEQRARVTDFMTKMFKVSNPSQARGNTITAREILDKASKEIDTGLAKDPEVQAQMMSVMGNVYQGLGLYPRAHPLLERAAEIRSQVLGPKNLETLRSKNDLAITLRYEEHYQESEKLARETLEMERRVLGPEHPDTLNSMNGLAVDLYRERRLADAEKLYRQTLEIQRRVLGPEHPDTLNSMNGLAVDLYRERRLADAEKLYRQTLEIRRRVLGPEHPDTLLSMANLGGVLIGLKRYPEAAKVYREALEIERRVLGREHPNTVNSMAMLASVLVRDGRYAEAEKLDREALEIQRRLLGPEHPMTLIMTHDLAFAVFREGHYAEGEKLLRETIEIQRRVLGPEAPLVAFFLYDLGCMAALQGHRDEAFSLLDEAVKILPESVSRPIEGDADLKSLHGDPRFAAMVARAKERDAAAKKAN